MGGWVGVRWERREGAVGAVVAMWGAGRLVWFRGEVLLVLLGRLIGGSEVGGREVSLVSREVLLVPCGRFMVLRARAFGSLSAFFGSLGAVLVLWGA